MIKALQVQATENLSQFSRLLWQQKISHRLVTVDEMIILAVPREDQVVRVQSLYRQWQSGEIVPDDSDSTSLSGFLNPGDTISSLLLALIRTPLTLFTILVCLVMFLLSGGGGDAAFMNRFLYPDFSFGGSIIYLSRVMENFSLVQLLKMISPILLHGDIVHIAFNMLWFWEFGKRIEAAQSSLALLLLMILVALVSNTVQYLYGGSIYFVGMSGVVYGMLGYIWMWQLFDPAKGLRLPPAMIVIMLVFLVLMSALNLDFVADSAHIGGIISGVFFGAVAATISRIFRVTGSSASQ